MVAHHKVNMYEQAMMERLAIEEEVAKAKADEGLIEWATVPSYGHLAGTAARLEREGMFLAAVKYWQQAEALAKHEINRAWCRTRQAFCRNANTRFPRRPEAAAA